MTIPKNMAMRHAAWRRTVNPARKSAGRIALAVRFWAACGALAIIFASTPAQAVTISAGVVLRPPSSWADMTFTTDRTFTLVTVSDTAMRLDLVTFDVRKVPASAPRVTLTFSVWNPTVAGEGSIAMRFFGNGEAGDVVFFNITGVLVNTEYEIRADGRFVSLEQSGSLGYLSFSYASWSGHDFTISVYDPERGVVVPVPSAFFGIPLGFWLLILAFVLLLAVKIVWDWERERRGG